MSNIEAKNFLKEPTIYNLVMEGSGRMVITAVGVNSQTYILIFLSLLTIYFSGIIMTLLGAAKNALEDERKEKQKEEKKTRRRSKTSGLLLFNFLGVEKIFHFIPPIYLFYFPPIRTLQLIFSFFLKITSFSNIYYN